MRIIVFFDLPVETLEDRKNYRYFRRELIKNGFFMIQESVYTRMLITPSSGYAAINTIKKNKPPKGIVQILCVTEKQFSRMEYIVGESSGDVLDSDERLVIL